MTGPTNNANVATAGALNGAYAYSTIRGSRFGGPGLGLYGAGLRNRGFGYGAFGNGSGYGNGYGGYGNRYSRYIRVYIPGIGWVLVPRGAMQGGRF
jgi:hypothetical protein